ncbi:Uncharacterised protein [Helicobacter pametensis]|nr:Uncharacterised protein [Helicobacter pametensis]
MFIGINLAAQNLLSTFNCQCRHLLTQSLTCPINFLLHISLSLRSNTSSLVRSLFFSILNNLRSPPLCVSDDFSNLIAAFSHEFGHTLFSLFEITFSTLGSSQAFGNFAGTLI